MAEDKVYCVNMYYCDCRHDDNHNLLNDLPIPIFNKKCVDVIRNLECFDVIEYNKNDDVAFYEKCEEIVLKIADSWGTEIKCDHEDCKCKNDIKQYAIDFNQIRNDLVEDINKDLYKRYKKIPSKSKAYELFFKNTIKKHRLFKTNED